MILGAGATLADGMHKPARKRPPLDRRFFSGVLRAHGPELVRVTSYMRAHYGADLKDPTVDSLERVMAVLYTDMFGGDLQQEAFRALRALIRVFLRRLASTTNDIEMTSRRLLYRLVVHFLNGGVSPDDLTIISFNQDIQAEKALSEISGRKTRVGEAVFVFPKCYHLPTDPRITSPGDPAAATFEVSEATGGGVSVLKLHGSLNWYSTHVTQDPPWNRLFDPNRRIGITTRKSIDTSMQVRRVGRGRPSFAFPIVIPPVVHKSGILHEALKPVWTLAQDRLRGADRVIIFGYSCPPNDWESANLLRRALTANRRLKEMSVIDPDAGAVLRYVELGSPSHVAYYSSAGAYLRAE